MSMNVVNDAKNDTERERNTVDGLVYETNGISNNSADPLLTVPIGCYAAYYKMNHCKRGLAIIFNHEVFSIPNFKPRSATNVDCDYLVNTLKGLGFEVMDYHNSTHDHIKQILERVANMDHSDHDCLVVAVMTHGEPGQLLAYDIEYKADTIWSYFSSDRCPTLTDKPKLFFIQACQGKKVDAGIWLRDRTECDSHSSAMFRIPPICDLIYPDLLIAFATVPGYFSWRNTTYGSWFIQTLCTELRKNGTRYDILTLLTIVSQRVALNFESWVPEEPVKHQRKQIPCITSTLTRLVKFTPPVNDAIAGNSNTL